MFKKFFSIIAVINVMCTIAQSAPTIIDFVDNNQCKLSHDNKELVCNITQIPEKLSSISDNSITLEHVHVDKQNNNIFFHKLFSNDPVFDLVLCNNTDNIVNIILNISGIMAHESTIIGTKLESLTIGCDNSNDITNVIRKKPNSKIAEKIVQGIINITNGGSLTITSGDYIKLNLNN